MIEHTKEYGVYHWDTFDNENFLVGEADTLVCNTIQALKNNSHYIG